MIAPFATLFDLIETEGLHLWDGKPASLEANPSEVVPGNLPDEGANHLWWMLHILPGTLLGTRRRH